MSEGQNGNRNKAELANVERAADVHGTDRSSNGIASQLKYDQYYDQYVHTTHGCDQERGKSNKYGSFSSLPVLLRLLRRCLPVMLLASIMWLGIAMATGQQTVYASATEPVGNKKLVYDDAGLLSEQQRQAVNRMANEYAPIQETDFVIYTTDNPHNTDVQILTEDLYDSKGFGYDTSFGNAVVLTMDMRNREVYLAGFGKAKTLLNDSRLDLIRDKITPYLSSGDYTTAFELYIQLSSKYMNYKLGVNPNNILLNGWFQVLASLLLGIIIVWIMAARSGGRVTVSRATYEDTNASGLLDQYDRFVRTSVSKRKIERTSNSGSSGGGGTSSGGNSHSGSRGSF
ncbi:TPM domain-containing protein [Paenibacillus campi]|uniref:TPM domain-containing protein n=1 Tax=Paenibacillus campi TaxID=3106031 RepID=UPI002AFF0800|nr:TPM domain-containing protein [Paenibacillus sp. SGZ-1014]